MENVGEGYAVMLVNAVAAEGLETVVMGSHRHSICIGFEIIIPYIVQGMSHV